MASYYYGSGLTWAGYLQADSFVRDVTGQIKKSGEATRHEISAQTREVVASNERLTQEFGRGFDAVNGTLEMGFDRLESALGDVEASIESLHSDFNYNMGLVLDQLQIQNQLTFGILERLDAIHKTLEHPELTKAREFYNRGCDRLSKGLLDKALEAFLNAEEKNDTDFFIQFQIGKLYLYGMDEDDNVIDLPKAEKHLRDATRYGKAEIAVLPEFKRWTGESLLHASIACYAQANDQRVNGDSAGAKEFISKAFQLAQQACEIYPSLSESQYHLAKYAALLGDVETSVQSLEKAVTSDVSYCLKTEFDRDFDKMRPRVFDLFERLQVKMGETARRRLQESIQKYITDMVYLTDEAKNTKNEINKLLSISKTKINNNTIFDFDEALKRIVQIEPIFSNKKCIFFKNYSIKNVVDYAIRPDGVLIAVIKGEMGGETNELELRRAFDGEILNKLSPMNYFRVSFSPDGGLLATDGKGCGVVNLWQVNDGTLLQTVTADGYCFYQFGPDGKIFATVNGYVKEYQGVIKLWQVSDGKLIQTIQVNFNFNFDDISFSPDWKFIAIKNKNSVEIWQASDGKLLHRLSESNHFLFSPDGKKIVTTNLRDSKLWQVKEGKLLQTISGYIYSFSPDGKLLAVDRRDNGKQIVEIWQVDDNKLVQTISGHIYSFSPDGKNIASIDKNIEIRRLSDGELLQTLTAADTSNNLYQFSPDGKFFATGNYNNIQIWQLSDGELLDTLPESWPLFSQDWNYFVVGVKTFERRFEQIIVRSGSGSWSNIITIWSQQIISKKEFDKQKCTGIKKIELEEKDDVNQNLTKQEMMEASQEYSKKVEGVCSVCGKKLSFWDKLRGRTTCPKHS